MSVKFIVLASSILKYLKHKSSQNRKVPHVSATDSPSTCNRAIAIVEMEGEGLLSYKLIPH